MICQTCGFDNPEGVKFCGGCGNALFSRCPVCGFENPPTFKFCGECGSALPVAGGAAPRPVPGSPEAERRQITVMFCDLVGSTALSMQVDPEELRELVREYQEVSARVVDQFEGYIAQYLGDGMLIYFGYPVAHEQEAGRAVRAGLGILNRIKKLGRQLAHERELDLSVRIGIHTGMVVVGEMGGGARREQLAMGEVPNIAARLQQIAAPGTMVISQATHRLVAPYFHCEGLGIPVLKGIATSEPVYRVVGEKETEGLLETLTHQRDYAPIGREQELELMLHRWEHVLQGEGQVVSLCGEGGIGKSHLVRAFQQNLLTDPHLVLECRCSSYHTQSAFHPIIELLRRILNFYPGQPTDERLDMIAFTLERNGFALPENVPLLAELLSVPFESRFQDLALTPVSRKEKTLALLLNLLEQIAEQQPLVFLIEDLHWADPSTLDLATLLIDQGPTVPILTLLTYRPNFQVPWPVREHMAQVNLARLHHDHVEQIVLQVTEGRALPGEVLQQIVAKTDGVPLFIEELTKMVLESQLLEERNGRYLLAGPLPPLAIPATLQDSLMARLDRLSSVKEVAQLASVLGRDFTYSLLRAVSTLDEMTLRRALTTLVDAELLYQRGVPPRATYVFKHALIQEAAYQSLLKIRRQRIHRQVAQLLERDFAEIARAQPELIAHHYTEAGQLALAVPFWSRAGEYALDRSANLEAISHLTRGLELLERLPEDPDRDHQQLSMLLRLGSAYIMTRGYIAPEVEDTFSRAVVLSEKLGDTTRIVPALCGQFEYHFVQGDIPRALRIARQMEELAIKTDDRSATMGAYLSMGCCLTQTGKVVRGHRYLQEACSLYEGGERDPAMVLYGQDLGVTAFAYHALALWGMGQVDRARARKDQCLALARQTGHPHTIATALSFASSFHYCLREHEPIRELIHELVALSEEHSFQHWLNSALSMEAWIRFREGHFDEALRLLDEYRRAMEAAGIQTDHPYYQHMSGEVLLGAGRYAEALQVIDEAITNIEDKHFVWWYLAEIYRMRGEILFHMDAPDDEVESSLQRALSTARDLEHLAFILRTTVTLARLRRRQNRLEEAYTMLSEVYDRFNEGLDTQDLQEARSLLDELQPAAGTFA